MSTTVRQQLSKPTYFDNPTIAFRETYKVRLNTECCKWAAHEAPMNIKERWDSHLIPQSDNVLVFDTFNSRRLVEQVA